MFHLCICWIWQGIMRIGHVRTNSVVAPLESCGAFLNSKHGGWMQQLPLPVYFAPCPTLADSLVGGVVSAPGKPNIRPR